MAAVLDADGRPFDMIGVSRSDPGDVVSPAAGLTQPAKRIWSRESSRESAKLLLFIASRCVERESLMQPASEMIQLTASQAACLDAVREGLDSKTKIAVETKQDLKTVAVALEGLDRARLVRRADGFRWRPTKRGRSCAIRAVPDPERRLGGKAFGRLVPGSTAERLLDALDRPMRGAELLERLGVTRQRVHQLIVKLHAQGRLKLDEQGKVFHIIARNDDPTILLTWDEERLLSVLPDEEPTSVTKITAATGWAAARVPVVLDRLCKKSLIEEVGESRGWVLYRVTSEGAVHPQRREALARAELPPLMVRSGRVFRVLSFIAEKSEIRIKEVRDELGIPHNSMNALMQYLKRRGLVRKVKPDMTAPYELTTEGCDTLGAMVRRGQR